MVNLLSRIEGRRPMNDGGKSNASLTSDRVPLISRIDLTNGEDSLMPAAVRRNFRPQNTDCENYIRLRTIMALRRRRQIQHQVLLSTNLDNYSVPSSLTTPSVVRYSLTKLLFATE